MYLTLTVFCMYVTLTVFCMYLTLTVFCMYNTDSFLYVSNTDSFCMYLTLTVFCMYLTLTVFCMYLTLTVFCMYLTLTVYFQELVSKGLSIQQVVHAMIIMAYYHSLSGMVHAAGIETSTTTAPYISKMVRSLSLSFQSLVHIMVFCLGIFVCNAITFMLF